MTRRDAAILCIDDEREMLETLRRLLRPRVQHIYTARSGWEGIEILRRNHVDLVLLDLRMPHEDGLATLRNIRRLPDPPRVVLMTGQGTVGDAVTAMRLDAVDIVEKPFSGEEVWDRLEPLVTASLIDRVASDRETADPVDIDPYPEIVGSSAVMRDLKATIYQLSRTGATVYVSGETGSGKELVARALHATSPRGEAPFIAVDCGSLPESMIESELFGHEKSAFTGADRAHEGLFRAADGGTLFLDEVGELSRTMQVRLLRVLQEREVRPVGAIRPIPVDIRVIAASNVDLLRAVEEGFFREDLYYRLSSVVIHVPPLREHPEDIPEIIHALLRRNSDNPGRDVIFSPEAFRYLMAHAWPGNVRELENVLRRTLALTTHDYIELSDMKPGTIPASTGSSPTWLSAKDRAIDRALEATGGNKKEAARLLGVAESTVHRNLKRRQHLRS